MHWFKSGFRYFERAHADNPKREISPAEDEKSIFVV